MDLEEKKREILAALATDFIDDHDFLSKINRLTFGLLKNNNIKNYDKSKRMD